MRARRGGVRRVAGALLWVFLSACAGCGTGDFLGIQIEEASGETRGAVLITEVEAGGLAAAAGVLVNDVIVGFNLRGVTTVAKLRQDLAQIPLGSAISIKIYRSSTGSIIDVDITLTGDANNVPTSLGVNVRTSTTPVGAGVVSVESASAAEVAGMTVGDTITNFGKTAIADVDQFRRALASAAENETVTVTFQRGAGNEESTDVTIRFDVVSRLPLLGMSVQDLSAELAERMGYPALGGVRVQAALIGGPAFDAGIMPRDVIFSFGNSQIKTVSDLSQAVGATGGSGTVTVGHARGGDLMLTDVTLRGALGSGRYTLDVGLGILETFGGLLVVEVASGTAAERAQLQLDDVITAVEGQPTLTVQEFYRQLDAALQVTPQLTGVSVTTIRNGVTVSRFLEIRGTTGGSGSSGSSTASSGGGTSTGSDADPNASSSDPNASTSDPNASGDGTG